MLVIDGPNRPIRSMEAYDVISDRNQNYQVRTVIVIFTFIKVRSVLVVSMAVEFT